MNNFVKLSVALLAVAFSFSAANAVDLNGKKGLGYAQTIGGADGLSFTYGANNLIIEGVLGIQNESFDDSDAESIMEIDFAAGAHFQALRADQAAFTVGGRIVYMTSRMDNTKDGKDLSQMGFDLPMRVYWFPNKHFSMHFETGISIKMGGDDAVIAGDVTPKGTKIEIFNGDRSAFGSFGASFWW